MPDPMRAWLHANPLRHRLLYEYAGAPVSPSELARRLGQPLNLVSYHTGVLHRRGWVELVGTEQRRGGTAHLYRALRSPVIEDDAWLALTANDRRRLVRDLLTTVAESSREVALNGGFDTASAHVSRWPMRLDETAEAEVADVLRRLLDDLTAIQVEADRRTPTRRVDVVLMGFRPQEGQRRAPTQRAS